MKNKEFAECLTEALGGWGYVCLAVESTSSELVVKRKLKQEIERRIYPYSTVNLWLKYTQHIDSFNVAPKVPVEYRRAWMKDMIREFSGE